MTLPRTKFVQSCCCLFKLGLLSTGDDNCCPILDKALSGHLTEARRTACNESDMILEIEEIGNSEIGAAGIHL